MTRLVARVDRPEPRIILIYEDAPGWKIAAYRDDPEQGLIGDTWEERLSDIPRYLSDYADGPVTWVEEESGQPVHLAAFIRERQ